MASAKLPSIPAILHNAASGFAYHETLGVFLRVWVNESSPKPTEFWHLDILPYNVRAGPYFGERRTFNVRKWWKVPALPQALSKLVLKLAVDLAKPQTLDLSGEELIDQPWDWSEEAADYTDSA